MKTFGSCFSGIGILDLAFIKQGWSCKWRIEKDKDKVSVMKSNFGDDGCIYYPDILEVPKESLESVNLIIGGPPCQDLSVCAKGSHLGLEGSESKLAYRMAEIIQHIQPKFFVMENVPKLIKVWEALESEGYFDNYETEKNILQASDFGGYTRRKRAFIVGHIGAGSQRQILDFSKRNRTSFKTGGCNDVLPMCLPWKGGLSLERLGACVALPGLLAEVDPL